MLSVAFDREFDIRNPILNVDGRGFGFEIDHIRRRLGLSFLALRADRLNNISTSSPSHFQRELQTLFWCRIVAVHRGCFR